MTDETFERQVAALEHMAEDKDTLMQLGKRLVAEVAEQVVAERKGAEIAHPDMELSIRKGEAVPPQLLDRVKVDEKGRALQDFTVQSLNLRIWLRVWLRIWFRVVIGPIWTTLPMQRFEEFYEKVNFSDGELKLMDRLRTISR